MRGARWWAAALAVAVGASDALDVRAHDSPEHLVARFTALMEAQGATPLLLLQRALEYRSLGQLDRAAGDLRQALELDAQCVPVMGELCRVQLAQTLTNDALATANRTLTAIARDEARRPYYMLRAEVYAARGETAKALADCDRAFTGPDVELDWYLIRSQLQRRLGRHSEAVAGLRTGFEKTGSAVLEAQWIESLIDAGRCREALDRIEPQLAEVRCQSSWLLRRARAWLGLRERDKAHADLRAAVRELDERLTAPKPDLTLFADRGLCHALLGDTNAARADFLQAKRLGAEGWILDRLEGTLARGVTLGR